MPNLDGTGPEGKGPKTGRGLGKCSDTDNKTGNDEQKEKKEDAEYGLGRGGRPYGGGGRGRRRGGGGNRGGLGRRRRGFGRGGNSDD